MIYLVFLEWPVGRRWKRFQQSRPNKRFNLYELQMALEKPGTGSLTRFQPQPAGIDTLDSDLVHSQEVGTNMPIIETRFSTQTDVPPEPGPRGRKVIRWRLDPIYIVAIETEIEAKARL
jgi:hypothetical protein